MGHSLLKFSKMKHINDERFISQALTVIVLLLFAVIFLSPYWFIVFVVVFYLSSPIKIIPDRLLTLAVLPAIFLLLLTTLAGLPIEGDRLTYYNRFLSYSNMEIGEFWEHTYREHIFYFYLYILSKFHTDIHFFNIFTIILSYIFYWKAIRNLFKGFPEEVKLFIFVFFVFFPPNFLLSLNVIRQFFCASLFFYLFSLMKRPSSYKTIGLLVFLSNVHLAIMTFVAQPLLALAKRNIAYLVILMLAFFGFLSIVYMPLKMQTGIRFIDIILIRVSGAPNIYHVIPLNIWQNSFILAVMLASAIILTFGKFRFPYTQNLKILVGLNIALCVISLSFGQSPEYYEISKRILFFIYFFTPIVFYLMLHSGVGFNERSSIFIMKSSALVFILASENFLYFSL